MEEAVNSEKERFFSRSYINKLIWPLVLEQFLALTIGACDTIMVSSIGEAGVSGVSLIDQFGQLVIQLFAAFATGGAIVSSQYLGHKDEKEARRSAKQLLNISIIAGAAFIVCFLPLRTVILRALFGGADEAVMNNALTYFVWILFSFPLLGIYNSCAALCRSMGNSKISLKVSLLMNVVNVIGNAFCIYILKIGVAGAGISTLISRAIAAVVMVIILSQKGKWQIYLEKVWKIEFDFPLMGKILKVAVPSGIENSVFHIGKTLVYSFMSGFGLVALAANAICNSVCSFSNIPGNAIGLAAVTLIGQCVGAGEKEEARYYGKKIMELAHLGMTITGILIFFTCPYIVLIFNLSEEARELSVGIIRTCMVANIFFWPLSFIMPNILRGAGDVKYTMLISNISMWVFRVFGSWMIASFFMKYFPEKNGWALYGVWLGMYIDWIFRGAMFLFRFCGKRWLEKKVI